MATRALTLTAALLLFAAAVAPAQEYRATLSGTIKDASGGALPGVTVSIVETRTGVRTQAVTDASGQYVAPFLAPGDYDITAELSGFKQVSRKGLHLDAGSHPVIDLALEVGNVTESVQVRAESPILNTSNASVGQTITTKEVEDLPLNGRTPMMLAQLAIGVVATSNPSLIHPFDNNAAAAWSIGGTPSQTSELLLDGAPDEIWSGSLAYSPPQDAVQEVSVKAFNTDAAYGHTFGGTLNQILKSGTNTFHGSGYVFNQPSALTANSFFNVKTGTAKPDNKFNQYGLTGGGPVAIPGMFDGRNKLFWFLALERLTDSQPATNLTTVPTDAERNGDFSALLKLGPQYQLYNPFSGSLNGSTITRQPFVNNVIQPNLLNSIAQAYLKYYPEPNLPGDATGFQNYINNAPSTDDFNNELGRVDYNTSSRSRLSVDIRHNYRSQLKNNFFNNIASGTTLTRKNWGVTGDEVFTINPTTVLDVRGNWTYLGEAHGGPSTGFDPTGLGFPNYVAGSSQYLQMPFIGFSGSCGSQTSFQCLGTTGSSNVPSQSLQLFSDVVKNVGRHAIKFGADVRQYRLDATTYGNSTGLFTFGTNWVTGPTSTTAASPFGGDFASFLLGLPTSGQYDVNAQGVYRSHYYAAFVQDDWRMTSSMTLNLGLRYEYDSPYSEEQGRTVNGFDPTASTSVATAAAAAYAKNPNPLLPPSQFDASGGLTFPASGGAVYTTGSGMVSPRVGFAWTPGRLHGKTVIRAGFGIFVQPITMANLSANGTYSSNPIINQQGFSATTSFVPTNNTFLTPANTLTDPFPSGILPPTGSSLGASTFLGQTISFITPQAKDPYSIRWNLGVQHELRPNLMAEVDYVANHTERLPVAVTQLNGIPRGSLSTLPTRDQAVINQLSASTANPFAGLLPGTSLNGSTITVSQLLAHYPQFPVGVNSTSTGVLEQNANIGSSDYDSVSARLQQRLSHGLTLTGTYTWSRLMESDSYLNDTDTQLERRISPFDHTNHFVVGGSYELPFGQGRAVPLSSTWARLAFEGWRVNGIYTYQTGAPIFWSTDMVYNGTPITLDPRQTTGPAFNTSAFATASKDQFQFHVRTFPSTFSSLRSDAINNFDASILKNFMTGGSSYLQVRFEAFNVLNHTTFSAPNVTPTSASFGLITAQANIPRSVQLGLRFVF
jgi:hypothetical protein